MAIITAAQAKAYLPQVTGTTDDTLIDTLITRADAVIARWLGWPAATAGGVPTIEDVTYTLYVDGSGETDLYLPVRPVVSITSVYDDPARLYPASSEVASGDYTADLDAGLLTCDSDGTHGAWSSGRRAIKITAVAGYATIPADIQHAACLLVKHWWRLRLEAGRESVSDVAGSVTVTAETIPESVRQILWPYRLPGVWCG